jgi:hypothetical protein
MNRADYSKENLTKLVSESFTFVAVLDKLGIKPKGNNYITLQKHIKNYGIDTSHLVGKRHGRAKRNTPITDYFSNKIRVQSDYLKKRMLQEGYLKQECNKCKLDIWNDKPIPLELNHKDENHFNNNLDNLEVLCPNCHAQYHKKEVILKITNRKTSSCNQCGAPIKPNKNNRCKKCTDYSKPTKINWPNKEELIKMIDESSICATARKLGVSPTSVKRRIK